MSRSWLHAAGLAAGLSTLTLVAALPLKPAQAAPPADAGRSAEHARIVEFWTAERRAMAIPRDFLLDDAGNAYLRLPTGGLVPYGRQATDRGHRVPMAKPGGGGGGGTRTVTSAPWNTPGTLQTAAGRILFQLDDGYYVCSGTVVADGTSGRSAIVTAAHCVYDDVAKKFARNVLFIPNQDQTTGKGGTDLDCNNDPLGCWTPGFGVVDRNWTTRTFPDNIPWDYAYYVVSDSDAHTGAAAGSDALDVAAGAAGISFAAPSIGVYTHALGYSYSKDPLFMYCAEGLATNGSANWWLGRCGLSGGSSGGPWIQDASLPTTGTGNVFSVNSWGYTNRSGMAGPKLSGTSASCLFDRARTAGLSSSGEVVSPPAC